MLFVVKFSLHFSSICIVCATDFDECVMSSSKLFPSWAVAIEKARLPTVDSLTDGTTRRLEPAERSSC